MMELKRNDDSLNTHNKYVTYLLRCNNDINMIATAHDAKCVMHYTTNYATKQALLSSDIYSDVCDRVAGY